MVRRIRSVYRWTDVPGEGRLIQTGVISEARLRAWEYRGGDAAWEYASGTVHDTVRVWTTARPDLPVPEELLVGDREEVELG